MPSLAAQVNLLRNGQLWTINSDGSGAQEIAGDQAVSFAWSPAHHQLVSRSSQQAYQQAARLPVGSILGAPDASGKLSVISIDGGATIQITPDATDVARSDAWWDVNGNRLVYREEPKAGSSPMPTYFVSQSDQPGGIARKALLDSAALPAISPDGSQVAVIDTDGTLRVGAPGVSDTVVATHALLMLPVTNRPAHLLWQPQHNALLYATGSPAGITLQLHTLRGETRSLMTFPALLDAAFSPDGSQLLVRTPQAFELWSVAPTATLLFSWPETDPLALPWWSPSGQSLLIEDISGWQLVQIRSHRVQALLTTTASSGEPTPAAQPFWHPAAGSPWNPSGTRLVFVGAGSTFWQGLPLASPQNNSTGLYVASLAGDHAAGAPILIDSGADRAPGWSSLDPSTTFLVAA